MPKLFEDFVTVALREALVPTYGGRVAGQDRNHFDDEQVCCGPDIVGSPRLTDRRHRSGSGPDRHASAVGRDESFAQRDGDKSSNSLGMSSRNRSRPRRRAHAQRTSPRRTSSARRSAVW